MKALVLEKNAVLRYTDVQMPKKIGKRSYLIRIAACGICGSDIHRGFENGAYHYPLIMGHEFSGIVEQTPSSESSFKKGQKVTAFPLLPCKKCTACSTGNFAQCSNYDYFGSRRDGAFAEYLYIPEENLFPVPDHVDIMHAAMTEPCAVALHGVRKLTFSAGDTVVVFGGGPIGIMAAQWSRIRGGSTIAVVDIESRKLKIARNMGFIAIDASKNDAVERIYTLTKGEGAQKVIEACGLPLTYRQAVLSAGPFAELLFLGIPSRDLSIPPSEASDLLRKELKLYGAWNSKITPSGRDDWTTVLKYMDREKNVAPLISHTPPLSEGADMFKKIVNRTEYINKVIFTLL